MREQGVIVRSVADVGGARWGKGGGRSERKESKRETRK